MCVTTDCVSVYTVAQPGDQVLHSWSRVGSCFKPSSRLCHVSILSATCIAHLCLHTSLVNSVYIDLPSAAFQLCSYLTVLGSRTWFKRCRMAGGVSRWHSNAFTPPCLTMSSPSRFWLGQWQTSRRESIPGKDVRGRRKDLMWLITLVFKWRHM